MAINKNFVVKHGLEVNTDLIFANAETRKIGIYTTQPSYDLDVRGGIGVTNLVVAGVSTFVGVSTFSDNVYVAGISTIDSGVSTGQTALTVIGDLRVTGDLVADDITFDIGDLNEVNVTGIGTINTLYSSGGNIVAGLATVGVASVGVASVGFASVTNLISGVSTLTGPTTISGNVSISGDSVLSGITTITGLQAGLATEFFAATGIQSGGVVIGGGVTTINFTGVGATLVTVDGTTANVYISGGPGSPGISSVGIQSGGSFVGNATTLNFVGLGIRTVSINDFVVDVNVGVSTVIVDKKVENVSAATSQFNFTYNTASIDVYYNGSKLIKGTDYTANNGSTIQLDFDAGPGDVIEFNTYFNSITDSIGSGVINNENISIPGIVTATGGFTSGSNQSPVKISVSGSQLIFDVAGIGSATLSLS